MDWLQFISSLISSLAWPLAAVTIAFLFRKSLASRLASMLSLTLPGGVEAKFSEKLISVEQAVPDSAVAEPQGVETPQIQPASSINTQGIQSKLSDLATYSAFIDARALAANPTGVVMEGWKLLEAELRAMHARYVGISARVLPSKILIKDLTERGFVSSDEANTLREMLNLRNLAAHSSQPISPESASGFAELAERLAHSFATRLPFPPPQ